MKIRLLFIPLIFLNCCICAVAQTSLDSLTLVRAEWNVNKTPEGLVQKSISLPSLYGGPQHICLIEVPRKPRRCFNVAFSPDNQMHRTSAFAMDEQALAAINGSFYNMKVGNSVCYLSVDGTVIDTTTSSEAKLRANAALYLSKGKVRVMPWSPIIEKNYRKRKGTTLVSGPLLLKKGQTVSWQSCDSAFIATKHPRSALFTKSNGTTVFLTVDGRAKGNAIGMSIPELAHLVRVLGAKEAINLDGGGSTTLWMRNAPYNGILNCPSDNRIFDHLGERNVSNIIYVR